MNWLDILVIIVALYSIIKGYRSGLIKQLASLASVIACILLSGKIATMLLPYIHYFEKIPKNLSEPAAFILAFIIIFLAFMLLGHMLQSILHTMKLGTFNKLAGATLSFSKWMIIVSLILNLFIKIDKERLIISDKLDTQSKTYRYVQPIAPKITPYLNFDF